MPGLSQELEGIRAAAIAVEVCGWMLTANGLFGFIVGVGLQALALGLMTKIDRGLEVITWVDEKRLSNWLKSLSLWIFGSFGGDRHC